MGQKFSRLFATFNRRTGAAPLPNLFDHVADLGTSLEELMRPCSYLRHRSTMSVFTLLQPIADRLPYT